MAKSVEEIAEERRKSIGLRQHEKSDAKQHEELKLGQEQIIHQLDEEIKQHAQTLKELGEVKQQHNMMETSQQELKKKLDDLQSQIKLANNYIKTLEGRPPRDEMTQKHEAKVTRENENERRERAEQEAINKALEGLKENNR